MYEQWLLTATQDNSYYEHIIEFAPQLALDLKLEKNFIIAKALGLKPSSLSTLKPLIIALADYKELDQPKLSYQQWKTFISYSTDDLYYQHVITYAKEIAMDLERRKNFIVAKELNISQTALSVLKPLIIAVANAGAQDD